MKKSFILALLYLLIFTVFTLFPAFAQRQLFRSTYQRLSLPDGMIPRSVLFSDLVKSSPRISPDGMKLAYVAPANGVLNIFVRTMGKNDDRVVTSNKKQGITSFAWQYDSAHLLYRQDRDGDEDWHIYQTTLATGLTRDLTPFNGVRALEQHTFLSPGYPEQMLIPLNLRDRRFYDVYRINLKTGEIELDTPNPGDVGVWVPDYQLRIRATQTIASDGSSIIRIRDTVNTPWREVYRLGSQETLSGVFGFTPDGKSIRIGSSVGANATRLIEVELASNRQTVIAEDPQYDVGGVQIHPTNGRIEAVAFVRARIGWQLLDRSLERDFVALHQISEGDFAIISRDLKDQAWIVAYELDDAPVTYYAYARATRQATLLFSTKPDLAQYKLAKMQAISFPARDGMTIYGYLTLPYGSSGKNLPLVLLVHGGPWARDTWRLSSMVQWLANRGYAVLQVNFRGSIGYGKDYLNAGDREWGGKMQTDLLDGKNWVVAQGYTDPKRVGIFGSSYGGYATLAGLAFTPGEFACGVDIMGISNLSTFVKHAASSPLWATAKGIFDRRVGNAEADAEFLQSRSPLFKAKNIKAPLLIAQGANDPRVKQTESDQIVAAVRKNGQPVEYLVFPDEGHGLARAGNRMKFFAAAEQFLAKHLGGRGAPPTDAERWDHLKK